MRSQVSVKTEAALKSITDLKEAIESIKVITELKNTNKYNIETLKKKMK